MSALKPRLAYCTGCGHTMPKMHLLFIHRGQERCGGRFLPPEEYLLNQTLHCLPRDLPWYVTYKFNEVRIDRDRMRHDRRQETPQAPPVRLNLPGVPRLTNAEAAAERRRVNRIRIGCCRKRHGV